MPIQPEPANQLLIIAATALIVCFLLYLVHRFWKHFTITSVDDLEQAHAPFDNYCALLDIAQRFQHIADLAQHRATICRDTADRMQRENNRQWKARHRAGAMLRKPAVAAPQERHESAGAPITDHINKLLTRTAPKNGSAPHSTLAPSRETTPRTQRPCYICNKPFGPLEPIRMDPKTGHVYHDGPCAIAYIEFTKQETI